MGLTHFNKQGRPKMVDVSEKDVTHRVAIARGKISMKPETLNKIVSGDMKKGDVLSTAQIGGIMGGKMTSSIIPMCHNIMINGLNINFEIDEKNNSIIIESTAKTDSKTGIEMEALTAVSVAALTIYDMCKAIDRSMEISDIKLIEKSGGKSGKYVLEDEK
ncbi:MAG: cyclic pyranopterin monophosphate synthase MoaC [Clostridiales bacterium]|nr:cyclic pyranopterin monophosphate synthase MoaC [Clostridiales bacterium]